jgi:hypothetical protein
MTGLIEPGHPEWSRLLTASKVSAVLGLSPWESPRSLWMKMHGDLPAEEQTRAQSRGLFLEEGVLQWWYADHPEATRLGKRTVTRPDLPYAAATPDDVALIDGEEIPVDAKTDSRGDAWGEPGTDQVPLHYLCQAMFVMHLGGFQRFIFTKLGPYLERDDYTVEYDAESAERIEAACAAFHASLASDQPPDLDGSVATYDALRAVVPAGDGDWDCPVELAVELCEARDAVDTAATRHNLARSTLLDLMGDARRAVCGGQVIAQKQRTKGGVALYPPRRAVDTAALTARTPEELSA